MRAVIARTVLATSATSGGSTGYLGMALDGKENANELHT